MSSEEEEELDQLEFDFTNEWKNLEHSEEDVTCSKSSALVLGSMFSIVFLVLFLTHTIDFSTGETSADEMPDIQSRIRFLLNESKPALLLMFHSLYAITYARVHSQSMTARNNQERSLLNIYVKFNNNFRNTIEQFILSFGTQLVLVTCLSADQVLNYIPALNILYIMGRLPLRLAQYRSYGFIVTVAPTMVILFYIIYKGV